MASRRRKRDNPDGVALGEWIFFGVLLVVPIACFGVYAFVSRICAGFVHFGDARRYCGFNETVAWFVDAGGWWKFLIALGVFGLFTFMGRDDKGTGGKASGESGKGTESGD
jgi:hypothetical protein